MHGDVREDVRERSSVMASNRALALLASVAGVAGLSCVDGALGDAVEWRVADGGNGHWYEKILQAKTWDAHLVAAQERGGHLATITSASENSFIWSLVGSSFVCWLGGRALENQGCDTTAWTWITGEPWSYAPWSWNEPNLCDETVLTIQVGGLWNNHYRYHPDIAVYEYSADCNSNGIVDYGEIRNGFIEDTNGNNIPDACECAADPSLPICCPADVIEDSAVNAIDLAAILNTWGTDGGKFPRADVDGSGVVDGADLAAVLSEWGPCAK
jgi:hypothetical protein